MERLQREWSEVSLSLCTADDEHAHVKRGRRGYAYLIYHVTASVIVCRSKKKLFFFTENYQVDLMFKSNLENQFLPRLFLVTYYQSSLLQTLR